MTPATAILSVGVAAALAAAAGIALMLSRPAEIAVSMAVPARVRSALVFVAQDQGFFAAQGLRVALTQPKHGLAALEALHRGEIDMAAAAGATTIAAAATTPLAILATLSQSDAYIALVTSPQITRLADLRGKRIGMFKNTSSQLFPVVLLASAGLGPGDYQLVPLPQEDLADALARGEVDALSLWHPVLGEVLKRFGDSVNVFRNDGSYIDYWVLATRPDWLAANGLAAEKVLRALVKAAAFAAGRPAEARAIAERYVPADQEPWDGRAAAVRLDAAFAKALERNADTFFGPSGLPRLAEIVRPEPLRKVAPGAVTIGGRP